MTKADKEAKLARARSRTQQAAELRRAAAAGDAVRPSEARVIRKAKYDRRMSGLEMLHARGKIDSAQRAAGERYGFAFREASIEGEALIKSNLAAMESTRGGGAPAPTKLTSAEVLAAARAELWQARIDGLRGRATLVAVCDVICGKQWTPQQVTPDRVEQVQIETTLRLALDDLVEHFRRSGLSASGSVAA